MSSEQKIKFVFRQIQEDIVEVTPSELQTILSDYAQENLDDEKLSKDQQTNINKKIYQLLSRKDQTIVLRKETESTYRQNFDMYHYLHDSCSWFEDITEFFMGQADKQKKPAKKPVKKPAPTQKSSQASK